MLTHPLFLGNCAHFNNHTFGNTHHFCSCSCGGEKHIGEVFTDQEPGSGIIERERQTATGKGTRKPGRLRWSPGIRRGRQERSITANQAEEYWQVLHREDTNLQRACGKEELIAGLLLETTGGGDVTDDLVDWMNDDWQREWKRTEWHGSWQYMSVIC